MGAGKAEAPGFSPTRPRATELVAGPRQRGGRDGESILARYEHVPISKPAMDLTVSRKPGVRHDSRHHKDTSGSDRRQQRRECRVCLSHRHSTAEHAADRRESFAAVEKSKSDRFLGQGFEMWPSWVRMVNEGKQRRPTSECGAVHVLPDEMT